MSNACLYFCFLCCPSQRFSSLNCVFSGFFLCRKQSLCFLLVLITFLVPCCKDQQWACLYFSVSHMQFYSYQQHYQRAELVSSCNLMTVDVEATNLSEVSTLQAIWTFQAFLCSVSDVSVISYLASCFAFGLTESAQVHPQTTSSYTFRHVPGSC